MSRDKVARRDELIGFVLDGIGDKMSIQKECERLSRPGRLFAEATAQALAASLREENDTEAFFA